MGSTNDDGSQDQTTPVKKRHPAWRITGIAVLAVVTCLAMFIGANVLASTVGVAQRQARLAPFYELPAQPWGPPGSVLRKEPLGATIPGGHAYRILYVSSHADGMPAASSGMIFIPDAPANGKRPVVAWAHGTVGQGDACAPSRSENPLADMDNWLELMMQRGYVVTATDYTGLGTPEYNLFLIGDQEARDVVNSVRAAINIPEAEAGQTYAVYGHSQGGHSALWTGHLSQELAPELTLVGVAAAAPAAELSDIAQAQWDTPVGWVIGPEILTSYPIVDPSLPLSPPTSTEGMNNYGRLAQECIKVSAIEGIARSALGQHFFTESPLNIAPWAQALKTETPQPFPSTMPVMLVQGTADTVVLAWTNAKLQDNWCKAGSVIEADWLPGVNHMKSAVIGGPAVVDWIAARFSGDPAPSSCGTPPPVPPHP